MFFYKEWQNGADSTKPRSSTASPLSCAGPQVPRAHVHGPNGLLGSCGCALSPYLVNPQHVVHREVCKRNNAKQNSKWVFDRWGNWGKGFQVAFPKPQCVTFQNCHNSAYIPWYSFSIQFSQGPHKLDASSRVGSWDQMHQASTRVERTSHPLSLLAQDLHHFSSNLFCSLPPTPSKRRLFRESFSHSISIYSTTLGREILKIVNK